VANKLCVCRRRARAVASAANATQASGLRRSALLGTVAAGMLLFGYGRSAQAQVVINPPGDAAACGANVGPTVTCTGNVSGGLDVSAVSGVDVLNVNTLNQNIAPADNIDGISFVGATTVTIVSDTGPFAIIVNDVGGQGIFASVPGAVSVTQTGDVVSNDSVGIFARSTGDTVNVNFTGDINAEITGITVVGDQAVSVTSRGDITSNTNTAIDARSTNGDATVKSTGSLNSGGGAGVFAFAPNGAATITSMGDVTAFGIGLDARGLTAAVTSTGDIEAASGIVALGDTGAATVASTGNITATSNEGIFAAGYGDTTVTSTGNITTLAASGIVANSFLGAANVMQTGNIETRGDLSHGILAYSYYGSVGVDQTGNISTHGDFAYGILAYSVYGSATVTQTGDIATSGFSAYGILADGDVAAEVTHTGTISTQGDFAYGILAYSEYGSATITQTGTVTTNGFRAIGLLADADGAAKVTHTGTITTKGNRAYGIYAYSYLGGPITVNQTGNITTQGLLADGLYAKSYTGSKITITQKGDITVGPEADGIDVDNPDDAGSSLVIIKAGSTITGGTGEGDGIDFEGGTVNRLKNFGTITTRGENAIEGEGSGAEIVDNYGTVTGNVHLGPGGNAFNNRSGGVFNSGATAYIGTGNFFTNAGTLSPGGSSAVQTTALTGNMVQTSGGLFAVDLNLGNATTDRVNVSGTANLAGTVKVAVQNPALLTQQFTILSAAGGTTNSGLGLLASPALQAMLLFPNPNDVVLDIDVDFAPDGLNRNQTSIGNNLNAVLGAGGGTLGPVFAGLFNVFTLNVYADALDQLSPEIYADTEIAALYSAFDFSDNLLSCHVNGATAAAINTEGECLWIGAKGRFIDGDATFEDIGFEETAGEFAAGAQVALNPVWRLGGGLGYQASTLRTDTNATSDGDQVQGGVALKYNPGALLLAGVLSGGHGWYDTTRPMSFGGFSEVASGDHELDILQGRLHASYVLGNPGLYYKPMLDAAVSDVEIGDVRERGAGGASLLVHNGNNTVFSVSPALEVGTEWWWSNGTLVRPYLRAGLTWYSEDDVTVAASFSGAPSGVAPFTIVANTDEVQADIAAGVEMISTDDSALRIFYDGQFGDRIAVHAAGFKASVKF